MSTKTHNFSALIVLLVAAGTISFTAFLIFLCVGTPNWLSIAVDGINYLVLDAILCFAFFLQHSGMIRRSFRYHLSKLVPLHYHGALFTIASGVVLLMFLIFWLASGIILLQFDGITDFILRSLYFLSLAGFVWSMWALHSIYMFGLLPIIKKLHNQPIRSVPFIIRGPYRFVRHPLYLFMIILFWSCPILTLDRLLFNLLWTSWVVIGTHLEERDLIDNFGESYCRYQKSVPMLFPVRFRPGNTDV